MKAPVLLLIANAGEEPRVAVADLDLGADLSGQRKGWVLVGHAFADQLPEWNVRAKDRFRWG